MIKISIKLIILITVLLALCEIISYCIIKHNQLFRLFISMKEPGSLCVLDAIEKSKSPLKQHVVLLGDSVANQILEDDKYEIANLTTNLYTSMAGQFILVNNLVKYQPHLKKISLLVIPDSLFIDINTLGAYSFFIKPVYNDDNEKLMSANTLKIIKSKPYHFLLKRPFTKVLFTSNIVNYKNTNLDANSNRYLSVTSQYYITKMKQICDAAKIKFEILPCPMSATLYANFTNSNLSEKITHDLNTPELKAVLGNYFNDIIVFDDKYFSEDKVHRKGNHWPIISSKVINDYNLDKLSD